MSIKQNGGVFGRNPTFNDVTIEGQLTFDGDIDINSDLTIGGDLEVNGSITAKKAGTALVADRTGSNGIIQSWQKDSVDVASMKVDGDVYFNTPNSGIRFNANALIPTKNSAVSNGGVSLGSAFYQYNNAYLSGNVILASGKGIDFSATAGTGTSELLDDYEEGTWTPAYAADGGGPTVTYSTQTGTYTKIGRVVTITCSITINTVSGGSGTLRIYGLPFNNGTNTSGLTNGFVYNFVTSPQQYNIGAGLNSILLYQNTLTNTLSTAADLQASAYLFISGSYTV